MEKPVLCDVKPCSGEEYTENRAYLQDLGATVVQNPVDMFDFKHCLLRNAEVEHIQLPEAAHFPLCIAYGVSYGRFCPSAIALEPERVSSNVRRVYEYMGPLKPCATWHDFLLGQDPSMTTILIEPSNHVC